MYSSRLLPQLLLVLLLAAAGGRASEEDEGGSEDASCADGNAVPAIEADSAEAVADGMKCGLCRKVTKDAFLAAVGFKPLGVEFSERYNKSLSGGDIVDIIDRMCALEEEHPDGSEWDFGAEGAPPTAMMDYYQLWVAPDTQEIQALWKQDTLRSQGMGEVLDDAARKLFMLSCDQHLRTVDTELADDLSELLQKHQKQLNELDWNSREMYARMLSDHEPLSDQIGEFCSILCDTGKAAKKALKNRKKKAAKKKKAKKVQEQRGSNIRYGWSLKQAKQSKVLLPGV